nr:hypothetical protein Iba_chr09eCG4950 [Ipomoea batatas]
MSHLLHPQNRLRKENRRAFQNIQNLQILQSAYFGRKCNASCSSEANETEPGKMCDKLFTESDILLRAGFEAEQGSDNRPATARSPGMQPPKEPLLVRLQDTEVVQNIMNSTASYPPTASPASNLN